MAAKKTQHGSKSAFVRGLPTDVPAKEVVARAKKKGLKLSIGQVYNIRSTTRKRGTRAPEPLAKRVGEHSALFHSEMAASADTQLRRLIGELGLTRSREVIAEVERTIGVRD